MFFPRGGQHRTRFALSSWRGENHGVAAVEFGGKQEPTGLLHLMCSSPLLEQKEKPIRLDGFLLVDDIGLEPMTFRTSSGCSSQLS